MNKRRALAIIVCITGVVLYWMARPDKAEQETNPAQADAKFLTEDMKLAGETMSAVASDERLEKPVIPLGANEGLPYGILAALKDCLGITLPDETKVLASTTDKPEARIAVEELLADLEKDLGPPLMQGDLWTDWIVRLPEGLDRKVHLENVVENSGTISQTLSIYEIDQGGNANRIHISELDEKNPDMTQVFSVLNSGEVQRKETSRYLEYAGGERLELIELNGKPTELEIVRDEVFFRCDDMKNSENCHCIR